MNTLQSTFEYEFLPVDYSNAFIQKLANQSSVDMYEVENEIPAFIDQYKDYIDEEIKGYDLKEKVSTSHFVLVTTACFENHHL